MLQLKTLNHLSLAIVFKKVIGKILAGELATFGSKGFTCVQFTMIKGVYMCTVHNDQRDLHVYSAQ